MMEDPPPCYSSHDEYPTSSEVAAAATTQPIRNPVGQTQHDDGNTYDHDVINEFEEHTADGHRRHGDGHRRHGDGHGRHDDGHRRHGDGHGRHGDSHRRHGDGHRRHDDGHRRHGDGHGRHGDGHRRHDDGRRHGDGHGRHGDGHGRHGDGYRRHDDGHGRHGDGHRRHDDGHRIHGDGHGRHANRHVGDVDGQERHVEYRQDDMRIYPDALNTAGIPEHTAGDNANRIKRLQNAFRGFIDIMHDQKKLPSKGFLPYKLGLCVYLFINVMYSIVAAAVQSDHLAYHLMYVWISLIGFVIELVVIIIAITRQCFHKRYVATQRGNQQVQDYRSKVISVLVDYVISSIGEFLIYPTLICVMYGFINERSWQFDNGISGCNFLLLIYSVIMDALYMKVYVIWLVIKIVQASYAKYDELTEVEWQRYFTPVYLSIPLAITTALTHWLMTGIIVVRIYVDNFTPEMNDTDSGIPDTGDYRVTSLTGYMIACTIYLPIVSWITYIIINKPWFYEVYSAISRLSLEVTPEGDIWDKKLFAFIKDPLAYIAIVFLMAPFIVCAMAAYLVDYDGSKYEVASSASDAIHTLGPLFIGVFLLSNLQAATTLMIVLIFVIITLVLCGSPICGVVYYKYWK